MYRKPNLSEQPQRSTWPVPHFFNRAICSVTAAIFLLVYAHFGIAELPDQTFSIIDKQNDTYNSSAACLDAANRSAPPTRLSTCKRALTNASLPDVERAQVSAVISATLLKSGDIYGARVAIQQALKISPQDSLVQANLGNLLMYEGDYQQAILAFNNALFEPDVSTFRTPVPATTQAALYLNRSLALRALGNYAEAEKDYALYLQLTGFAKSVVAIEDSVRLERATPPR